MKRYIFFLSIIIIMCTGCGKTDKKPINDYQDSQNIFDEEYYYINKQLAESNLPNVMNFFAHDNRLYLIGYDYGIMVEHGNDTFGMILKQICFTMDGTIESELVFDTSEINFSKKIPSSGYINNNNTWVLYHEMGSDDKEAKLICYDLNGLPQRIIDIGSTELIVKSFYVSGESGNEIFYVYTDNMERGFLRAYDSSGVLLFIINDINGMTILEDGRLIIELKASQIADDIKTFFEVDENGSLTEEIRITTLVEEGSYSPNYLSGNSLFEMISVNKTGIFGFSFNGNIQTKLVDWVTQKSKFDIDKIPHIVMVGDDFYYLSAKSVLNKLTKTDEPPESAGRKILNIIVFENDYTLPKIISAFNNDNSEYELRISSAGNIETFSMRLATGDIAGDIIVFPYFMPINTYINKGFLVDLYEFISISPDISKEDLVPNLLESIEFDGRLYFIPHEFWVSTVIGRVADVGNKQGWTWDDFNTLMASKPAGTIPISWWNWSQPAESFFMFTIVMQLNSFVDYNNLTCSFDSPEFINLLETVDKYYPTAGERKLYPSAATDFMDGNPLLLAWDFNYFGRASGWDINDFISDETTYIGYPTMDGGSGNSFGFWSMIAISAKSEMKEGAFAFLQYLMLDAQFPTGQNLRDDRLLNYFPINVNALHELMALENDYYTELRKQGFYELPSADDNLQILNLIKSTSTARYGSGTGIYTILEEESSAYFNSDKTAEEVAKIIQNRVSLYLKEMD